MERYFGLYAQGTDVRTEFIAGVTTFLTMVYIIFVNPIILGKTGMDQGAVFVATCVAAAVSTLVMAFYANYPIALAPGMGINAFFAFTVVLTYKYTWQQALAAVFCSGVLFFLISVFRIRQYVINSIPHNLKLACLGRRRPVPRHYRARRSQGRGRPSGDAGHARQSAAIRKPVLMLLGFVLIAALNYRAIMGGTLIGILVVDARSACRSASRSSPASFRCRRRSRRRSCNSTSRACSNCTFLIVVFSILFVDVFDNAGTLIGVTHRAGLMKDGKLARMKEALISDSFAAMFGALIGTSTTTSYIESAAGVAAGGRTGLTAVFVALFFLLALFFSPLAGMIPAYASAAALLYVACVMARGLAEIDWDDITEYAPAVVTAITMPLTYSIATGIGLGFITYALAKLFAGSIRDSLAGGGGPGGSVRGQICGGRMNLAASWQAWAVLSAMLCGADRHLRQGRRRETSMPISRPSSALS